MKKRIEYFEKIQSDRLEKEKDKNLKKLEKCLEETENWRSEALKGFVYKKENTLDENKEFIRNLEKTYENKINECHLKYNKNIE